MPETDLGDELAQAHRQQQLALRAELLAGVLAVWPSFDIENIDGSWPALEVALTSLVVDGYDRSARMAGSYYSTLRSIEGPPGLAPSAFPSPVDRGKVATTLRILGPIAAKKAIARKQPQVAATTLTRLSGSVGRQALNGGRDALSTLAQADPDAAGYRRITSGSPCQFCADLAAQGITGADVDFAAHDHCGCTQRPVFTA